MKNKIMHLLAALILLPLAAIAYGPQTERDSVRQDRRQIDGAERQDRRQFDTDRQRQDRCSISEERQGRRQ